MPRADLDPRAVPRAHGNALLGVEVALAEGAVVVGAAVLERAVAAAEVVDADGDLARVHDLDCPGRQLVDRRDVDVGQLSGGRARPGRPTPRAARFPSPGEARPSARRG